MEAAKKDIQGLSQAHGQIFGSTGISALSLSQLPSLGPFEIISSLPCVVHEEGLEARQDIRMVLKRLLDDQVREIVEAVVTG